MFLPSMGLLRRYFKRHLGLAMGVAFMGSGVGQMFGPLLFVYLVGEYGLKGTLLIWGGIQSHHLVCALLMRPTHFYTKWRASRKESNVTKDNLGNNEKLLNGDPRCQDTGFTRVDDDKSQVTHPSFLDTKLFRNIPFLLFNLSLSFLYVASVPIVALIIPAHGHQMGLSLTQVALLSTLMGIGSIIGRPLLGFVIDRNLLPASVFFAMLCGVLGVLLGVIPHVGDRMVLLGLCSWVVGFIRSSTLTVPPALLSDLVHPDQYTMACGWTGLAMGLPNLFNNPLFGM